MIRGVNFGLPIKKRDNNNTSLFGPYYKWNSYCDSMSYNVYVLRFHRLFYIAQLTYNNCYRFNLPSGIFWCRINYTTTTIMMTFNLKPTRKKLLIDLPPFSQNNTLPFPPSPPHRKAKIPYQSTLKITPKQFGEKVGKIDISKKYIWLFSESLSTKRFLVL